MYQQMDVEYEQNRLAKWVALHSGNNSHNHR